jgi:hypothetical protein
MASFCKEISQMAMEEDYQAIEKRAKSDLSRR